MTQRLGTRQGPGSGVMPDDVKPLAAPAVPDVDARQDGQSKAELRKARVPSRPAAVPARQSPGRGRLRRGLLFIGPLAVALVAFILYLTGGRTASTDNAYVKADMVTIGPEVAGTVAAVAVAENQPVTEGQTLFRLDDGSYRIALARAEAELAAVASDVEALRATYRQHLDVMSQAETDVTYYEKVFARQSELLGRSAASQNQVDQARHDLDAARDQAALDLTHAVLAAPADGIVTNLDSLRPGLYLAKGTPALTLVETASARVEANLKETDLSYVRSGQPATVTVDSYPGVVWHGRVASIKPATGAEFALLPPQNASGNWVKVVQRIPVRIALDPAPGAPPLRAGMSVWVEIATGHRRRLGDLLSGVFGGRVDAGGLPGPAS